MIRMLLGTAIGVAMCVSAAQAADTVKLRMANWLPPVHHLVKTLNEWNEEVKKASGGTLVIELDKAPLAKPPGQYDLVKQGIADLAFHVAGYTPGRFHALRATELPFLSPSAEAGSKATWDWYSRHVGAKETDDVHLVTVWVHGPGLLHSKEKITTLEELKGVKLRVGGGGVAMAEALGAVPVALSAPAAHESLQRGTTDGTLFPWEAIYGFKLTELVTNHLEVPGGLYATPFMLVMNKARYEGLSAEHRKVIDEVGGMFGAGFIGKRWDEADQQGKDAAKANGNTIRTISEAELARWKEQIQFMNSDWIKTANEGGWDGEALLADLRATMQKYAKSM